MIPGRFDLRLYRGDARTWRFRIWADLAGTIPVDLAGAQVDAQIRGSCRNRVVSLTTVVTAPNIIDAWLSSADAELLVRHGRWDLQLTWPGDVVQTVLFGDVVVIDDVTVVP